jgi:tetratricopeptide (TPR) repeat protein
MLQRTPRHAHAHYLLGMALRMQGRHDRALRCLEEAFANGLNDPAAHYQFGRLLLDLGGAERAEAAFRRAIDLKPDFALASRDLGNLLYESDRFVEAADRYRTAIRSDPNDWTGWHNLAHALYRLERFDEAITTLDEAIALSPGSAQLHAIQATLYELDHNVEAAERCARQSLAFDPESSSALVVLAKLAMRKGNASGSLAYLDQANRSRITERQAITWYAERGRAFDRLGRYKEAFESYTQSGTLLSNQTGHVDNTEARSARLTGIEKSFAALANRSEIPLPHPAPNAPQPIFVLGFMRSGTTLIERILGAHPDVVPLGELKFIAEAASTLEKRVDGEFNELLCHPEPSIIAALTEERDRYLVRVQSAHDVENCAYFVDKAPFNSEHIGLIQLLFPQAPIIHAVRHPLDVVLSSYFVNFLEPNAWSRSLSSAANWYARIHEHMATMHRLFPDRIETNVYENLVADTRSATERLLSYVGLPWNDRCLRFHEQAHGVRTASYEQVSRPVYGDSVYRFRNYLPYIGESVIARLRPAMDAYNYDLGSAD